MGDQDGQSGEGAGSSCSLRGIWGWRGTGVTGAAAHNRSLCFIISPPAFSFAFFIVCDLPLGQGAGRTGPVLCGSVGCDTGQDTGGGCHIASSLVPSLKENAAPHKNPSLKSL